MSVRRVILAMDAAHRDEAALHDATRIAAQLDSAVTALLVRDPNLERFAGLPGAMEVLGSARTRRVQRADLDADFARVLRALSGRLGELAHEARVAWSVASTPLHPLGGIEPADLLLVERRAGHVPVGRREIGSLTAALLAQASQSVLVYERRLWLDRAIALLLEPGLDTALDLALDLARAPGRLLAVLTSPDQATFTRDRERLRAAVAGRGLVLSVERLAAGRSGTLAHSLHRQGAGLLVLDERSALLRQEGIANVLESVALPVVLARTR